MFEERRRIFQERLNFIHYFHSLGNYSYSCSIVHRNYTVILYIDITLQIRQIFISYFFENKKYPLGQLFKFTFDQEIFQN